METTEGQCGHKGIYWGFWTPQCTFTTICFWKVCVLSSSVVSNSFVTPWTGAYQAPLSMGSPRQEYWSGLPCPPAGDLPNPGIKPASLMSPALTGRFLDRFFTTSAAWEGPMCWVIVLKIGIQILLAEGLSWSKRWEKTGLDSLRRQPIFFPIQ